MQLQNLQIPCFILKARNLNTNFKLTRRALQSGKSDCLIPFSQFLNSYTLRLLSTKSSAAYCFLALTHTCKQADTGHYLDLNTFTVYCAIKL